MDAAVGETSRAYPSAKLDRDRRPEQQEKYTRRIRSAITIVLWLRIPAKDRLHNRNGFRSCGIGRVLLSVS